MSLSELYRHGGVGCKKPDTHRGPVTSYKNMSLPPPPKGYHWVQDTTSKEWTLCAKEERAIVAQGDDTVAGGCTRHIVQPTDTFQGLCLKYKVTPTQLRQANGFSGTNLLLAPHVLTIPGDQAEITQQHIVPTRDEKILLLRSSIPGMARSEAKAYLELNNWNVQEAIQNAKEDFAETEHV